MSYLSLSFLPWHNLIHLSGSKSNATPLKNIQSIRNLAIKITKLKQRSMMQSSANSTVYNNQGMGLPWWHSG